MGWNSADEIFEPVAWAVIGTQIDSEDATKILETLISTLQSMDWDTEDECLELFKNDIIVVDAFKRCGITLQDEDA